MLNSSSINPKYVSIFARVKTLSFHDTTNFVNIFLEKCTKFAKSVVHFVQPPRMRISCAFSFASCLIKATICAENFMTSNTGISYGEAGTGLKLQKTSKLEIVNRKLG